MEVFDKWDIDYCSKTGTQCPTDGGCSVCTEKRKDGFRAALEWVLSMKKKEGCINDPMNMYYHIPDWAIGKIEEELKG